MSITVVSPSPAPAPTAAPNSGGDAAAGQDFANLLQGQLTTNAAQTVAALLIDAPTDAPTTDAALLLASSGDSISTCAVVSGVRLMPRPRYAAAVVRSAREAAVSVSALDCRSSPKSFFGALKLQILGVPSSR